MTVSQALHHNRSMQKRLISFQVGLRRDQKEQLTILAAMERLSVSRLVRKAIDSHIQKNKITLRYSVAGAWSHETRDISLSTLRKEDRTF